jgi:hypothetical protein
LRRTSVMCGSQLLGVEKRVEEVHERGGGQDEAEDRLESHLRLTGCRSA